MKTLLASSLTALLAISILAPAQAAGYFKFDGIDGEFRATQQALEDLKAPETEEAIALLLPAIQKVREAASRMSTSCEDPTGAGIAADCAAATTMDCVLESFSLRNGSPGLLDLVALALNNGTPTRAGGTHIKTAKLFVRKQGTEGAAGTEKMIIAILIGLGQRLQADGLGTPETLDPIIAAIGEAEEIDPSSTSCKVSGYDLKLFKGTGNK